MNANGSYGPISPKLDSAFQFMFYNEILLFFVITKIVCQTLRVEMKKKKQIAL